MIIDIPKISTIREYKNLKKTQQEIHINQTSKELDSFVYDKAHKFNNAKSLGILAALDLFIGSIVYKTPKKYILGEAIFMLLFSNAFLIDLILDSQKNKKHELKKPEKKLENYIKAGLNAKV